MTDGTNKLPDPITDEASLRTQVASDDDHYIASGPNDKELLWLIEQLINWPTKRVDPHRTMNDRFLRYSMAATMLSFMDQLPQWNTDVDAAPFDTKLWVYCEIKQTVVRAKRYSVPHMGWTGFAHSAGGAYSCKPKAWVLRDVFPTYKE